MKTLVVPDVHLKISRVKKIIDAHEDADETVFLGDWFDSFPSKQSDLPVTVGFLNNNHTNPQYRLLFGNHDLQYAYPRVQGLKCSGWTGPNDEYIQTNLDYKVWTSFEFAVHTQGWVISHAGIHSYLLPPYDEPIDDLIHRIEYKAYSALDRGEVCLEIRPGMSRGGSQFVGGLTWLDWDAEFEAVPEVNQIVGHSYGKKPRMIRTKDSTNWCIDTGLNHIGIIEDGILTVEPV